MPPSARIRWGLGGTRRKVDAGVGGRKVGDMTHRVLICVLMSLLPAVGGAEEAASPRRDEVPFGAVVAPAAMPDGATALYGWAGAPEVGAGFRQGLFGFELEARARFNWFQVSGVLEVVGRKQVWTRGPLEVAPTLGLGLVLNSGATGLDEDNFSGVLLRIAPGAVATYQLAEPLALLGQVDLPFDLGLSPTGARRFQALAGGGAEVYVGSDLTLSAVGQLGVETFKEEHGVSHTRLGWALRVGLGVRLF